MISFKKSRTASFAIIVAIYVLSAILGIIVYKNLDLAFYINLLIADVAATAFVFLFSVILKNASVYDPYWSVQPIVILLAFATGSKLTPLKLALLLAVLLWGVRLTANWGYTFKSLRHEDWRYELLRERTGPFYPIVNFVGIHMVPTLVVYLCILPAVAVMLGNAKENFISYLALALSVGAVALQGFADVQMHAFRKSGKGGFIREGLWKNCRHPNYLGEILMWWGIGISAVAALGVNYLFLLIGAVANTALFLFVSIPLADGKQSKKVGYAEYRAQTRALLPIPKK